MDTNTSTAVLGGLIAVIGALIGLYLRDMKTVLGQRIDGLDKRLDGLDKRIDGLEKRIEGLDKRIDGLQSEMANRGKALARIEGRRDPYVPSLPSARHPSSLPEPAGKFHRRGRRWLVPLPRSATCSPNRRGYTRRLLFLK